MQVARLSMTAVQTPGAGILCCPCMPGASTHASPCQCPPPCLRMFSESAFGCWNRRSCFQAPRIRDRASHDLGIKGRGAPRDSREGRGRPGITPGPTQLVLPYAPGSLRRPDEVRRDVRCRAARRERAEHRTSMPSHIYERAQHHPSRLAHTWPAARRSTRACHSRTAPPAQTTASPRRRARTCPCRRPSGQDACLSQ